MKKNNLLKTVLLLVFTILFLWSCRQESLYTDTKNNNNQKVHNKISLNTFKQETKVSKIEEFTVLKNSKSNGKDAGTTSTFIIDSTSIYKLAVNNNLTTYSFKAYNIFESPNVLYNLVYHIKDGKTGYRIFKMEKDSAIPVYDSEIGAITIKKSSSKSISKTAGCTESIKIYIWDCKNGHDWEHCDHCKDCYDVSYYDVTYDCSGGLSGGSGTSTGTPPSNNAPQCGESNAGYSGVMLDPSGYYFDPNEPLSIDAEKLRASYAYNFWNQLDQNHQLWVYNGNIDTYQFILENYLNHYSTTNNTNNLNFANWAIGFLAENTVNGVCNVSWTQFQNWFIEDTPDNFITEIVKYDPKTILEYNVVSPNFTMSKLDQIKYPRFTNMVKNLENFVSNNPIVLEALKNNTGLSESKILEGLKWGKGPIINIKDIEAEYGDYSSSTKIINVNAKYVRGLEVSSLATTQKNTSFLLAITVLHEYTHYGDHIADGVLSEYEMGWGFEQDILGKPRLTVVKSNAHIYVKMFKF